MITESGLQPLLALIFIAAGAAAYVPMITIGWLRMRERLPVLEHIAEGVWGLFFCLVFVLASHIAYDGQIKYFTILCFLAGALLSALFLKLPLEKVAKKLRKIYLRKKAERTQETNKQ